MAVPFAICEKPLLRVLKGNLYRLIARGRINELLGRRVAASTDHRSDINRRTISTRSAHSSRNLDRTELNCVHGVGPLFFERKTSQNSGCPRGCDRAKEKWNSHH